MYNQLVIETERETDYFYFYSPYRPSLTFLKEMWRRSEHDATSLLLTLYREVCRGFGSYGIRLKKQLPEDRELVWIHTVTFSNGKAQLSTGCRYTKPVTYSYL